MREMAKVLILGLVVSFIMVTIAFTVAWLDKDELGILIEVNPSPTPEVTVTNVGVLTQTPTPSPTPIPEAEEVKPALVFETNSEEIEPPADNTLAQKAPEVSQDFLALQETLQAEVASSGIDIAVAVTNLQTGETISVNGNDTHRTGCVINLFAFLVAVEDFQAGRTDPASVSVLISNGINHSQPPSVKLFLESLRGDMPTGVARARELMEQWGMEKSFFHHVPYYGDGVHSNRLTALETNLVLQKLWNRELFNEEWTTYALDVLGDSAWYLNHIIPGQLPSSATVAHKVGWYWDFDGWVKNNVGIVSFVGDDGDEKAYVIS
ncbi:serine hydrolase, partial [Patescibacteria group bacterium]|nr:serine hydrolase [Patescibacteria group bacterium]